MRRACDFDEARVGHRRREPAPRRGPAQRVAAAGDDERRLRDAAPLRRAGRPSPARRAWPQARDATVRRAPTIARASRRASRGRARCRAPAAPGSAAPSTSTRRAVHRRSGRACPPPSHAANPSPATKRGVVQTSTSRATRAGPRERPTHRDKPSHRPAEHGERPRFAANAAATAAPSRRACTASTGALRPCPGRSTAWTRWCARQRAQSGPQTPECIAQPCSSTSGGP